MQICLAFAVVEPGLHGERIKDLVIDGRDQHIKTICYNAWRRFLRPRDQKLYSVLTKHHNYLSPEEWRRSAVDVY